MGKYRQFLFLGLLFVELSFSTFYLKLARSHPIQPLITAVDEVRWNTYAKRPRRSFIMLRREGNEPLGEGVLDLGEWKPPTEDDVEMDEEQKVVGQEKRFV